MRHETIALDIATADAQAGTAREVGHLLHAVVYVHQVTGGDAFSVKVQGKAAGQDVNDDWVDLTGAITTPTLVPLAAATGAPLAVSHVRIYRTTIAVGTKPPKACVAGFNTRTDGRS